jgi:adenine-specific DNA-methyltransferase
MTEVELRHAIAEALKKFDSDTLGNAATHLLDVLGYASTKRLALKPNTLASFLSMFSHGRALNDRYALPDEWKSVDFLFQLTDEEVRTSGDQQFAFESKGAYNGAIINSYLFFAIELKDGHYSRTTLAGITREVNKLFDMPALVLFRHGETLTLAIINRRLHKREAGKDVLEKVTLIQDIKFMNTHRAHIDILSDLSIGALHRKHPFSNFVGLHEAWQKTLDTSELNKRFFQDLANWYFWALPQVRFPKNAPKDTDGQDSMSLIRLITRVIFCWFLKEKGLLPEALFDEHTVQSLLTDHNPKESSYYKAILQNLFFATLNQEMDKREFRRSGQNFMAHNLYRYKSLLQTPNETLKLFAEVPFMNGGLFECLDKTLGSKEKPQYIRIDGFSDRDDNLLKVPNDLFWGQERPVDLSGAYGESKFKSSKVAGLIRIFNRYKFTITENTPIEEEVALDPELLGKVFENLLAAYNPETGATARKQTGSFYTPREIVNYMVDESLIASLKTKLAEALPETTKSDERLRQLFAYNDRAHEFTEAEVGKLIKAIDSLTILDPACGSGAFPMGILHKLVFVLAKLDPGNQRWKARQLAKAEEIPDSTVRERVLADIAESFNANELDFGRKLYLIENCIYGVDIQPIAVQISKLRFFISLVVEQTTNLKTENRGIRPLPNLETKFVAANTLLGIERPGQQLLRDLDVQAKEVELRQVRERHFLARTPSTKTKYRDQDAVLRTQLAELLKNDGWDSVTAKMLAGWDPYDQNSSAPFFDTEWMFGLRTGFDVVIGNPPYINIEKISTEDRSTYLDIYGDKGRLGKRYDVYQLFIMRGVGLNATGGVLGYILPNTFLMGSSYQILRRHLWSQTSITSVVDLPQNVFESATVDNVLLFLRKLKQPAHQIQIATLNTDSSLSRISSRDWDEYFRISQDDLNESNQFKINVHVNPALQALFAKIEVNCVLLGSISESSQGIIVYKTEADADSDLYTSRVSRKGWKKLLRGTNIGYYSTKWGGEYLHYGDWLWCSRDEKYFNQPKILLQAMRNKSLKRRLVATYDDELHYNAHNLANIIAKPDSGYELRYILGILNSSLINFWYRSHFPNVNINPGDFRQIPIRAAGAHDQAYVVKLVERILNAKKNDVNCDTSDLESDLDKFVYSLYGMSASEVAMTKAHTEAVAE